MLSKATDPDLQTSSVLDVQTSYGNVIACDAREKNKEYARSRVLNVQSTRSKLSCLAACFRYSLCSHAVYVGGSGRSPPSCVMLGGQLRSRTTGQEFRGHTCHILTMVSYKHYTKSLTLTLTLSCFYKGFRIKSAFQKRSNKRLGDDLYFKFVRKLKRTSTCTAYANVNIYSSKAHTHKHYSCPHASVSCTTGSFDGGVKKDNSQMH